MALFVATGTTCHPSRGILCTHGHPNTLQCRLFVSRADMKCKAQLFGHRTDWAAPHEPPEGEDEPLERPELLERGHRILAARRHEAAAHRQERGDLTCGVAHGGRGRKKTPLKCTHAGKAITRMQRGSWSVISTHVCRSARARAPARRARSRRPALTAAQPLLVPLPKTRRRTIRG